MIKKKLSVIIPVYKGEGYIKKNLKHFKKEFKKLAKVRNIDIELIAVIDGYLDNSLKEARTVKDIKVVGYKQNRGKGYAIKYGFSFSSGDIILFLDGDGDFQPQQINNFFPYLATAELVIGSKRHPFSKVKYPVTRHILSIGFQLLSRLILGINIRDTQSGFKVVKREVLEIILPLLKIERYAFDLELCFLAQKHGFRLVEAPIRINFKGRSSVNMGVPVNMFYDLLKIRARYTITRYYQKKFHKEKLDF